MEAFIICTLVVIALIIVNSAYNNMKSNNIKRKVQFCTKEEERFQSIYRYQQKNTHSEKYSFAGIKEQTIAKKFIKLYAESMNSAFVSDKLSQDTQYRNLTEEQYFLLTFWGDLIHIVSERTLFGITIWNDYEMMELTEEGVVCCKIFLAIDTEMFSEQNISNILQCIKLNHSFADMCINALNTKIALNHTT